MSDKITGGPAFPVPSGWDHMGNWGRDGTDDDGMTLRDYFAAKALPAVIARGDDTNRPGMAEWAYDLADAMLKAREA